MMPANVGDDALVPPTSPVSLPDTTSKFQPWTATSGYPRPVRLNVPPKFRGIVLMKDLTAAFWYDGAVKTSEKPPPVKLIAFSGPKPCVEPTDVRKGQEAGKTGMNVLLLQTSVVS